jgi:hypothetical protein
MALTRIYGKIVFICDNCEDTLETETESFDVALVRMRKASWEAYQVYQGRLRIWKHYCKDCP